MNMLMPNCLVRPDTKTRRQKLARASLYLLAGWLFSLQTQATPFLLNYEFLPGTSLIATVEGTLLADNDTIEVSAITDASVGGLPAVLVPVVTSVSDEFAGSGLAPRLSLSGTIMDLLACSEAVTCASGFLFDNSGALGSPSLPIFSTDGDFGSFSNVFSTQGYSLTAVSVSEPSAVLALLLAMLVLGLRTRSLVPGHSGNRCYQIGRPCVPGV